MYEPDGEPLTGVNIVEKGTYSGTTSDQNGTYHFQVSSSSATVVFSFMGYATREIALNGRSKIDVTFKESTNFLEEIQVVGSRSHARSSTDSPVAIDVIDVAELASSSGKIEVNQILQYAAPSFNATKQSGSDGADHIVPASLRGLGPDQTLVLINGKRRHQSSLVNVFGTRGRGNSGTDLNAIPASAIKRIEVLRDGASAQYGSDAIAGVINIVLKDNTDGVTGGITYGANSTGIGEGYEKKAKDGLFNIEGKKRLDGKDKSFDGNTVRLDLNYGIPLGNNGGYANFTIESLTRARTLRPGWSWRKGYGSAGIDGFNFMLNFAVPINKHTEVYAFGGRNYRDTDAYAFTREAFSKEKNRTVPSLYPNGFTPRITSSITDVSVSSGVKHSMKNGWRIDFNNTYGKNDFHYFIRGTNNASMGKSSPTDFDAGGHSLSQNTTSLDFSKYYPDVASGANIAFGLEYRTENFVIFSGEESSYALYDTAGVAIRNPSIQVPARDSYGNQLPSGSQGFPGYRPSNEVNRNRTNIGFYVDAEMDVSEAFLLSAALRFENYSDFGGNHNFKLASRYKINENLSLRGSASTGFRAPSLPQIHYNLLFNNIVGGKSVRTLLSSNTSTVTKAFGIKKLREETAFNGTIGFTFSMEDFSATVDFYLINVDDRIILTDNFDASSLNIGVKKAQFFANGVDTKTKGMDIVINYTTYFGDSNGKLTLGLAGNINNLEIQKIHNGSLNKFTFFGPFSQAYLKAAAPENKVNLNIGYSLSKFEANISLTRFSKVILQDFQWVDTPATNQTDANKLFLKATDTYDAATTLDLSFSYAIQKTVKLTIGGNNILNTYPTPQFDGWTDQGGFSDSVQMGSDGLFLFARLGFKL